MNNMKEVKIIQSTTEPNKNHLWLSDEGLKQFKGNGWEQVLSNNNGGSGGGSTNGHEIIYVDVSNFPTDTGNILSFMSIAIKVSSGQNTDWVAVLHPLYKGEVQDIIYKALAFDLDVAYSNTHNAEDIKTVREVFESMGGIDMLPKITKEQFYNLNE